MDVQKTRLEGCYRLLNPAADEGELLVVADFQALQVGQAKIEQRRAQLHVLLRDLIQRPPRIEQILQVTAESTLDHLQHLPLMPEPRRIVTALERAVDRRQVNVGLERIADHHVGLTPHQIERPLRRHEFDRVNPIHGDPVILPGVGQHLEHSSGDVVEVAEVAEAAVAHLPSQGRPIFFGLFDDPARAGPVAAPQQHERLETGADGIIGTVYQFRHAALFEELATRRLSPQQLPHRDGGH